MRGDRGTLIAIEVLVSKDYEYRYHMCGKSDWKCKSFVTFFIQ